MHKNYYILIAVLSILIFFIFYHKKDNTYDSDDSFKNINSPLGLSIVTEPSSPSDTERIQCTPVN